MGKRIAIRRKRKAPTFIRKGKCKRCGKCCVVKNLYPGHEFMEWLDKQFDGGLVCPHLERNNGKATCKIHKTRPEFCRNHPTRDMEVIKGCGFRFERDNK